MKTISLLIMRMFQLLRNPVENTTEISESSIVPFDDNALVLSSRGNSVSEHSTEEEEIYSSAESDISSQLSDNIDNTEDVHSELENSVVDQVSGSDDEMEDDLVDETIREIDNDQTTVDTDMFETAPETVDTPDDSIGGSPEENQSSHEQSLSSSSSEEIQPRITLRSTRGGPEILSYDERGNQITVRRRTYRQ